MRPLELAAQQAAHHAALVVAVRQSAQGEHRPTPVAATGNGMASAELPFIFNRVYRGAQSRSRASGGA